ncbi:hypothetical protein BKA64DRAFT_669712 [Cadophora sp. MPI-SDFR-AT-0126]|nr:hypothetical protein BKA64DRAFT_669712 [Leotiomycetes sp. MPI-SDFR-AT-0126]
MELSTYKSSGINGELSASSLPQPSSSSPDSSDLPKSSAKRQFLPAGFRSIFKSTPKLKPIILGSEPSGKNSQSSKSSRFKDSWRAQLHPRPLTEYMALNFGIFSGFSLTGSSVGGLIAGAGLGLMFGLGAASVVAVGWELCSPGHGRQRGVLDGDGKDTGMGEVECGDMDGVEMRDFAIADDDGDKVAGASGSVLNT